jgi:hypothetical protein
MDQIDSYNEAREQSTGGSVARGVNRYPRIELDKSLNFDRFFSEKAKSKKQQLLLLAQARLEAHKH